MAFTYLSMLFLLFRAGLLVVMRISTFVRVTMSEMVLVAGKALLMFGLLNKMVYYVFVILKLVEFVLLEIDRDRLIVTVIIIEEITRRSAWLMRLVTRVH